MAKGSKGNLDKNRVRISGYLFDESIRATGRRRDRVVVDLMASMEKKQLSPHMSPSSLLAWARDELPKGRFEGIPWFFLAMGKYFETIGNWNDAQEWYRLAIDRSGQEGYRGIYLDSVISLGHILAKKGVVKEARRLYKSAFSEAQDRKDHLNVMRVLGGMGALHFDEGRHGEARGCWRKALQLSERIGEKWWTAHMLNDMGALYGANGSYGRALSSFKSAQVIYKSLGHDKGLARCLHNIAAVHLEAGQLDPAGSYFHLSQELADALCWEELTVMNLLGRVEMMIQVSEYESALSMGNEALDKAVNLGDPFSQLEAKSLLFLIFHASGDREGAFRLMEECIARAKQLNGSYALARVLEARVQLMLRDGDISHAARDLERLKSLYSKMGLRAKAREAEVTCKKIRVS
ncbi:MAG: tetratricopeptide repeat protein [Candidatus Glassbacteria bacterium]